MKSDRALSGAGLIALGVLFCAFPLVAVTQQSMRLASGETIIVPAQVMEAQNDVLVPLARLDTPLHSVSLADLTGDNKFVPGDTAYLFVTRSNRYVYPFAISRRAPIKKRNGKTTQSDTSVMLASTVTSVTGDQLTLSFDFDIVSPPQAFLSALAKEPGRPVRIQLAVSQDGKASVGTLFVGQQSYSQRVIPLPELEGRESLFAQR